MGRIRTVKLGETSTRFKSISNTLVVVWSQYSSRASYALRPLPSPSSPIPSQSSTVLLLSKWMLSNSSVSWLGASFAFQFKAKSLFAIIALCYIWQPPALNCVSTTVLTFHPGFIVPGKDGFFCNHGESDAGCIYKPWLSVEGDKHWTKCYGNFMLDLIWQPSKGCAFWFISRCCRKCVFSYFMCW